MNGWIKCTDKMPAKDTPVLLYGNEYFSVGEWWPGSDDGDLHAFCSDSTARYDVTHWMPLPETPQAESE